MHKCIIYTLASRTKHEEDHTYDTPKPHSLPANISSVKTGYQ